MPSWISLEEADAGNQGNILAFLVASGYYPTFGPKGRSSISRRFAFQNQPIFQPSIHARGLHTKGQWSKGGNIFPGIGTLKQLGAVAATKAQKMKADFTGVVPNQQARAAIIRAIRGNIGGESGFLAAEQAKYALRGNYVWWNSGVENVGVQQLATDIYDMMTADLTSGRGGLGRSDILSKNTAVMEGIHDSLMGSFRQFESTDAVRLTKAMVNTIVEGDLSADNLMDYATESFEAETKADAPEEEIRILGDLGYFDNATMEEALEQMGNVNKADVRLTIRDALGNVIERLQIDASETMLGEASDYSKGKHGWISALDMTDRSFEWIQNNEREASAEIRDHMLGQINSYNEVIRDILAYTVRKEGLQSSTVPTLEQVMGPGGLGGQTGAGKVEGAAVTPAFFGTAQTAQHRAATGSASGSGANEFLDEVARGHFGATQSAIQSWLAGGFKTTKEKGEEEKIYGVLRYILKGMSQLGTAADHDFYHSQKVSRDKDPVTGFSMYAFIPMSLILPGQQILGGNSWTTNPYEFQTVGPRSPEATFILPGPSATLAFLISRNVISASSARLAGTVQHIFSNTKKAHSENIRKMSDRTLLSTASLTTDNKHGFTISWSPKRLNDFFKSFVSRIEDGMKTAEIEQLADSGLAGKAKKLTSSWAPRWTGSFWALPYIGFEDNLKRKSGEALDWYDEATEKDYGGPAVGGVIKSQSGWQYLVPE